MKRLIIALTALLVASPATALTSEEKFMKDYSAERYVYCMDMERTAISLLTVKFEIGHVTDMAYAMESVIDLALLESVEKLDTELLDHRQKILTGTNYQNNVAALCMLHFGNIPELRKAILDYEPVVIR